MGKLLVLALNEQEEKIIDKIIEARLEYGTLVFLAPNPNRVFTQSQIFETVWNMESNSCHSSVVNVIYNLQKKD